MAEDIENYEWKWIMKYHTFTHVSICFSASSISFIVEVLYREYIFPNFVDFKI